MNTIRYYKSIFFCLITFTVTWYVFYSLPWAPAFEITVPQTVTGAITVDLVHSNGKSISKIIHYDQQNRTFEFVSLRLKNIHFSDPKGFVLVRYKKTTSQFKTNDLIEAPSERNSLPILFSISLISLILTIIFGVFFNFLVSQKNYREKLKVIGCYVVHLVINLYFLRSYFPGLFSYDSFENYYTNAIYVLSPWTGGFYSSFTMPLFQLFPVEFLIPVISAVIISYTFTELYSFSAKHNKFKWYVLACLVYYIFPSNWGMSLDVGRDPIGNWLIILTLIKLYIFFLEDLSDIKSKIYFGLLIVISCLIRQESIVFIPPVFLLITFFKSKKNIKWALLTSIIAFSINYCINILPFKKYPMGLYVYQTTTLINPLSYILAQKYPTGLPENINKKLGPYFKNDYLIKYQSELDIQPFHHGGVNRDEGIESYKQFRYESLKIFATNPLLFLKNRIHISNYIFGFGDTTFLYHDNYITHMVPEMIRKKEALGFRDTIERNTLLSPYLSNYFFLLLKYPLIFCSYLFTFGIFLISFFFLKKAPWYKWMLLFLIVRTLIVCLTAPAAHYKYNYILCLFSILMIPILAQEVSPSNKQITSGHQS